MVVDSAPSTIGVRVGVGVGVGGRKAHRTRLGSHIGGMEFSRWFHDGRSNRVPRPRVDQPKCPTYPDEMDHDGFDQLFLGS